VRPLQNANATSVSTSSLASLDTQITNEVVDWDGLHHDSQPWRPGLHHVVCTTVAISVATVQPAVTVATMVTVPSGGTSTSMAFRVPISSTGSSIGSSAARILQSSPALTEMGPPPPLSNTSVRRSLSDHFSGADASIIQTPTRSMTRARGSRKRSFVDQPTTNIYTDLKVIKETDFRSQIFSQNINRRCTCCDFGHLRFYSDFLYAAVSFLPHQICTFLLQFVNFLSQTHSQNFKLSSVRNCKAISSSAYVRIIFL
jgi:hypothetical protein